MTSREQGREMMEGGKGWLKQRLARVFRASTLLRSTCTPAATTTSGRSLASDIAEEPVFVPGSRCHLLRDRFDRSLSFPSSDDPRGSRAGIVHGLSVDYGGCRPTRDSESGLVQKEKEEGRKMTKKERRIRETGEFYETGDGEGRTCPPVSPSSPSETYYYYYYFCKEGEEEKKKKKQKSPDKESKKKLLSSGYGFISSSSVDSDGEFGFFSSEEREEKEAETETLISSKSFSSDSSEFYQRPSSNTYKKSNKNSSRRPPRRGARTRRNWGAGDGFRPLISITPRENKSEKMKKALVDEEDEEGEGEGGFAVVKCSTDPYEDFRSSMVEMIMERQIFGASELESLFQSYLSLNSHHHHSTILQAFSDIWDVLFAS